MHDDANDPDPAPRLKAGSVESRRGGLRTDERLGVVTDLPRCLQARCE